MARQPRVPEPEGLNAEFYERAHAGVLHLQRCSGCGRFRHPPRYYCAGCGSPDVEWVPSPGRGRLVSWTVTHFPFDRGWAEELPYATVVVELDEGVRVIGAVEGVAVDALEPGLRLGASLEPMAETFTFITFRPDST